MKKSKRNKLQIDRSQQANYDYHLPVLAEKSCDFLVTDDEGVYVDGTLGGGGHTEIILGKLGIRGKLLAFDKDEEAIKHCRLKFEDELSKGDHSKLHIFNESFLRACSITKEWGVMQGILLDLGVSSRQLDDSRRGFTYRENAPIDLRFASHGRSAEELINAASEDELESILSRFGEEPFSRLIARRIVNVRRISPVHFTLQLRAIVEDVVPFKMRTSSLSRVFQAFRIAVNDELNVLGDTLDSLPDCLAKGGRIVVITYHSLEDRIVKNKFRQYSKFQRNDSIDNDSLDTKTMPVLKILTPKPLIPDEKELLQNPRARSAKLRVAEKI